MEYRSAILSLSFYLGTLISLFWGIHIIRLNPKATMNRIFLLLCITLSMWSFGFAAANASDRLAGALFWRRFSAVGWTAIFSIMLHFLLLMASQNHHNKWEKYFFILYIPAMINMYVFALSNTMAKHQYNLVKIPCGWANIALNNGWDYVYYFYYFSYMLVSLFVVWKWKEVLQDDQWIRQVKIIFMAIFSVAILGSFIDLSVNMFSAKPMPQMGPLFALLPAWAMYHSARYYGMLNIKKTNKGKNIISCAQQRSVFTSYSIGMCLGGIFAFVFEFTSSGSPNSGDLGRSLMKSSVLIVLGISIFLIQNIKNQCLKEKITTGVLVSSVPIITFQFLSYSAITVWVYPIIIIISSLLFNKRALLILTTIIAIITQRLVWIFRPASYVLVDKYDFILRIGIIIICFFVGSYVNKLYTAKIKENEDQMDFQKIISDVLFEFVSFNQDNFDEKVNYLLEKIGVFFNVDRTYLFTIDYNNDTMTYSNEWCNTGIKQEVYTIEEMPLDAFPWWIDQLNKKNIVSIEDVDNMPEEASEEQKQLRRQGVRSLVSVPVMGNGKVQAFIGIDSLSANKVWSEKMVQLLNIMANILSRGITPIKTDQETAYMAYYDSLTKLPNRFLFADQVNQAIYLAKRTGKQLAVMFIDLDGFKTVNDAIGHRGGDVLLRKVAKSLGKVVGKTDVVARFGGDEFMILMNNIDDDQAVLHMADEIMKIFSHTITVSNQDFLVTASGGVAMYPADGETSDDLVKNADIAMYKAKSKGKNQYALCTEEMKEELQLNIELSNDLARALERDELVVYYQPQMDLATNTIAGVEALLRWNHPTKGIISPGIFIPLAEKNNLINSIGDWVLKTACLQNKKWQDMGFPYIEVAVNLSAIQIINPNIAQNVEDILKETGLDPRYIELEITESIAITETDYVIDVLDKLKEIGVSISIDDFGTEYSSMNRLKVLPIDKIKIDMQFVQGIESSEKDKAIIQVIINLGKSLGLSVLAEGVETVGQLEFLKQERCDYVQGYYYYKPMPAKEIEEVFRGFKAGAIDEASPIR